MANSRWSTNVEAGIADPVRSILITALLRADLSQGQDGVRATDLPSPTEQRTASIHGAIHQPKLVAPRPPALDVEAAGKYLDGIQCGMMTHYEKG